MATIKAPFNFVPLNEEPYIPQWTDEISHDIPFNDGLSGSFELSILAETPIFISDKQKSGNANEIQEFCHTTDNKYFISSTSIKGALRNVMEILSFGKMAQVQNQSFGIRDLSNGPDGKDFYRKKVTVNNVHCGWLYIKSGRYYLDDCGFPWRISAERLDEHFEELNFSDFIKCKSNFDDDANRTARKKYDLFNSYYSNSDLEGHFVYDAETENNGISAGGRMLRCFSPEGQGEEGTLVFTGQPGVRERKQVTEKEDGKEGTKMKWFGKFFEFIFPKRTQREGIEVPEHILKAFLTIHKDSPDYKDFRKDQLMHGNKIPVFFIFDEKEELDAMGLSYMFKYPTFSNVYNGIPLSLPSQDRHDLYECIFGYISKDKSLKGRVQFHPAILQTPPIFYGGDGGIKIVLSKPHPSYYPLYLGKGKTWNSKVVRIAGRKRYPVRDKRDIFSNNGSEEMERWIKPLDSGSLFQTTVTFHNLRPIELGALLCSIDFCGNTGCSHNLGQGKPLGYGKVRMAVGRTDIRKVTDGSPYDCSIAINDFKMEMEQNIEGWAESDQLKELFALARGIPNGMENTFEYMTMSTNSSKNEFKKAMEEYTKGIQLGTFCQIISGADIPRIPIERNSDTDSKRIDIEKGLLDIEFAIQVAEQTDLSGKEGLVITDDAINRLSVLPDNLKNEKTEEVLALLRKRYKEISKILLRSEKTDTENNHEQVSEETAEPIKEPGVLAELTYFQKNGNNISISFIIKEGNNTGKKEKVVIAINVNNKNINWKKVKFIRVDYQKDKKKYVFLKVV